MALTRAEKERIADNRMKIRSVANSLAQIDPAKVDDFEAIQECLEGADKSLAGTLKGSGESGAKKHD
jgi:hypothetical protein